MASAVVHHDSTDPLEGLSTESNEPEFLQTLRQASKYKVRSSETYDAAHAPLLESDTDQPIDLVLLGDSMFERFLTTGKTTKLGGDNASFPTIMNAGVGGDRIVNVVYRLVEKGLLFGLQTRRAVKNIMIEMGTNDIANDKQPVRDSDIELYALVIEALRWACPGVKICVCALNPRLRVKKEGVDKVSNDKLQAMVYELRARGWGDGKSPGCCSWRDTVRTVIAMGKELTAYIVDYMPANLALINHLEDDGLHLNEKGYEMFAEALWEKYQMMKGIVGVPTSNESSTWSHVDSELNRTDDFEGWKD